MPQELALVYIKPVCKRNCPDRTWDCHTWCEKYKAYRAECDRLIHQKDLDRDVVMAIGDAMKRIPGKRGI